MTLATSEFGTLKYVAVAKAIEQDIKQARYQAGDKLPPERSLAKQFNVALLTVRQALKALEDVGMISRQQGRGTFVTSAEARKPAPAAVSVANSIALLGLNPTASERDNPANWEGLLSRYQGIVESGFEYGMPIRCENVALQRDDTAWLCQRFANYAGVIIHNDAISDEAIAAMMTSGMVVVQITYVGAPVLCHQVQIDARTGAQAAVTHLLRHGHRRIATIVGDLASPWNRLRYEGYTAALRAYQVPVEDELVISDPHGLYQHGAEAAEALMKLSAPPTALFCTDTRAVGALKVLKDTGLSAPNDLAIVGYNDHEVAASVGLSTIHNPIRESGAEAVRLLFEQRQSAMTTPAVRQVTPYLVVRQSCGAEQ